MIQIKKFFAITKLLFKQNCKCRNRNKAKQSQSNHVPESEIEYFFLKACKFVKKLKNVQPEVQLQLYGFFKQQKDGDAVAENEEDFDYIEKQKFAAWKQNTGLTQEEAWEKYVEVVLELDPEFKLFVKNYIDNHLNYLDEYENVDFTKEEDDDETKKAGTTFGLAPSKMTQEEEYVNEELDEQEDLTEDQQQIFEYIQDGDLDQIKELPDDKFNFKLRNQQGISFLHSAVDNCQEDIVKFLVEKVKELKIDINIQDIEGQTPLHYAVLIEDEDIIQLLVENGADINMKDKNGESPYDSAGKSLKEFMSGLSK